MNKRILLFKVLTALSVAAFSSQTHSVTLQRIASGLEQSLYVTAPTADFSRLFVLEKASGNVKIISLANNQVVDQPFLQ